MKIVTFEDLIDFCPKSKRKASEGMPFGKYPFYRSSQLVDTYCECADYDSGKLVFGTGGSASVHYVDTPFSTSADCIVAKAKNDSDVHLPYIFYYFRGNIHVLEEGFRGAGLKHISKEYIRRIKIPLPTFEKQRRIAAILDKADEVRRKRQEAIRLTEELLRSAFLDMFGDPVTNPKGWPTELFGEVGKLDRGRSRHRPRNAPELLGGPYPLIQTGDVANAKGYIRSYTQTYSELGLAQSKMWPAGTLCITIAANIAKTAILAIDACFPDSVVGFKPNGKVRTEYIQFWLSFLQKILEESAPESAQKNINLEILRTLKVPVPPISLQDSFVFLVQKIEANKEKMEESTRKYNDLFNSLVQRAFKGEL